MNKLEILYKTLNDNSDKISKGGDYKYYSQQNCYLSKQIQIEEKK